MSLRGLFLFLFLFLALCMSAPSFAELSDEERLERQKVLNQYADENTRKQIEEADKKKNQGVLEKSKEAISNTFNNLKEKLPSNVRNMLGDKPEAGPKYPGGGNVNVLPSEGGANTNAHSNTTKKKNTRISEPLMVDAVEPEMMKAQENGEVLDPDNPQPENFQGGIKVPDVSPEKLQEIMKSLEGNPILKMLPAQHREAAAKMMHKNPFTEMGKVAVKKMILSKMDPKHPAGKFIHESPKLVDFAADWVVDDKAIPSFVSIIAKKNKAKFMGGIFIAVFITVFLINLKKSKKNILQRIIFQIAIMLGSFAVNASAFYIIYREELAPTLEIAKKYI